MEDEKQISYLEFLKNPELVKYIWKVAVTRNGLIKRKCEILKVNGPSIIFYDASIDDIEKINKFKVRENLSRESIDDIDNIFIFTNIESEDSGYSYIFKGIFFSIECEDESEFVKSAVSKCIDNYRLELENDVKELQRQINIKKCNIDLCNRVLKDSGYIREE